jgi:hypothetical protein
MKYIINPIGEKTFEDKQTKRIFTQSGYAFIDEFNHCIIIVYGESRRDSIIKLLT